MSRHGVMLHSVPHAKLVRVGYRCRRCKAQLSENRSGKDWLCDLCLAPGKAPDEPRRDLRRTTARPIR
jgi:hypothetical protein